MKELAEELREVAVNIESFFDHKRAAKLMRAAADILDGFAAKEPPVDDVAARGEQ